MANIADIKKIHKTNLSVVGIIMTMFSMRNNLSKEVVDEVRKHFPLLIFDSIIPRSVKIAEAPSFGQTIIEYEPKSVGTIAYTKAAVELSKKTI
jgi:chromosome partitioning protein